MFITLASIIFVICFMLMRNKPDEGHGHGHGHDHH
jgi:hypothetical protein